MTVIKFTLAVTLIAFAMIKMNKGMLLNVSISSEEDCISSLISKLVSAYDSIAFVSEDQDGLIIPHSLTNPYVVITQYKLVQISEMFYNYYVISISDNYALNQTMFKLRSSLIWDDRESPRAKFIVITKSPIVNGTFDILWKNDITKAVVVSYNKTIKNKFPGVYTWDPFEQSNNCGKRVQPKFLGECNQFKHFAIRFSKENFKGCHIKMVTYENVYHIHNNILIDIISRNLKKLFIDYLNVSVSHSVVEYHEVSNILHSQEEGITVSPKVHIIFEFHTHFDLSQSFYSDEMIWVVPKPPNLSNVEVLNSIYKASIYWLTFLAVCVVATFMWLIVRLLKRDFASQELSTTFLAASAWLFRTSSYSTLVSLTLRVVFAFYMIFCIAFDVIFQGKLTSILAKPGNELGIRSMNDLASSNLIALVPDEISRIMFENPKFRPRFIAEFKNNITDNILKVVCSHNYTTPVGRKMFMKMYPRETSMLNLLNENTGLVQIETTLVTRKGHNFLNKFNKMAKSIVESGISDKWFTPNSIKYQISQENDKFGLDKEHLRAAFIWLISGIALAITLFLIEQIIYQWPTLHLL